jgi:hypothetical protein
VFNLLFRIYRYLANNSSYLDIEDDVDTSNNYKQHLLMKQTSVNANQKQTAPVLQTRAQSKLENLVEVPLPTMMMMPMMGSPQQFQQQQQTPLHISPLVFNSTVAMSNASPSSSASSYPNTANSTVNILPTPPLSSPNSVHNYQFNSKHYIDSPHSAFSAAKLASNLGMASKMNGALIDIELYQTRYCTRLKRKRCLIECLVSLDHRNGDFIEIQACAPEKWREELFYFTQDLYIMIEQKVLECCSNVNLEKHYLLFKPVRVNSTADIKNTDPGLSLGVVNYEAVYSPKDLISMQLEKGGKTSLKLIDLVCCGSEQIEKNLIQGVDLPVNQINDYTRYMLCNYLDKTDPMGRDWSILAFLLGLQDYLPKLDEEAVRDPSMSKCNFLLGEWSRQMPDQATVRNLLSKIRDLGRKDVHEMIVSTVDLFKINLSKDSGIQNSNQTLASLK